MMKPKLELKNVTFTYGDGTPYEITALNNVDITIFSGIVTGIIGHTGSGKSTLLRLLNGLEKPQTGHIFLDGEDIWSNPKKIGQVRYRVGLVMQYPEYQLFEETVEADIAFGPRNMGLDDGEIADRVAKYSAMVGLDINDLKKSPFDLSGGQKRRAAIAGVMAMKPEVLVLDEPAAGLDPIGKRQILDAVHKYSESSGATVIIVSHSMEDMAELCDRVIVLCEGNVICDGTRDEVFSQASKLKNAGLDIPELTNLSLMLSKRGFELQKTVYTLEDTADEIMKKMIGIKQKQ